MEDNYKTSQFYLAVFLLAKGLKLAKIDKMNPKRFVFIFDKDLTTEDLRDSFIFGEDDLISAKEFVFQIKSLKARMYDEID